MKGHRLPLPRLTRRPPPLVLRARPRARLLLAALAAWAVAATVQLGLACLDARQAAQAAQAAAEHVRSGPAMGAGLDHELERARDRFGGAAGRAGGVLLAPARMVPVAGRQLQSFATLARAAERLSGAGATALASARQRLERPVGPEDRVAVVGQLGHILTGTRASLAGMDLGPHHGLVGPLATRRAQLRARVDRARSALANGAAAVDALRRILAGDHRYLFLAANNAEMRAGSGMFLEAGILDVHQGSLSLGPLRPTAELALPGQGVALDADLAGRWGWLHPGREWRNLGLSPRFDVTGPLAARMWTDLTGQPVDGVMAVDVEALRAVLAATGPLPAGDVEASADTVVERLLHDQYVSFGADQAGRRDQLGEIAGAVVAAVDTGRYDTGRLALELAGAARGRHVLLWSSAERDQAAWVAAGVSGNVPPSSLLVAVLNRGGNKLDRFLDVGSRLDVLPVAGGRDVAVRVRLRNTTPPGEPPYVAGPHPDSGVGAGVYLGLLAVDVPGPATDLRVDGDLPVLAAGPDGASAMIATPVLLAPGEVRSYVVRFHLAGDSARLRIEPSARIPAVTWRSGPLTWRDDEARVLSW